jgi:hypothetical protein
VTCSDRRLGRWRIARKVAPDRVISTVDREARHTRKSKSKRRDGFRGHVAAEPETGLVTECEMTMAAGPGSADAENGVELTARDRFHGGGLEVYGDSAYGSGDARAAYQDAGHDTVIKPGPLRPAVPGGFTIDDFTVDEEQGTVTCPAGHTVALSRARVATFGALCRDCPLRARCTTCKTGRKLVLHERDDLLRAARAD